MGQITQVVWKPFENGWNIQHEIDVIERHLGFRIVRLNHCGLAVSSPGQRGIERLNGAEAISPGNVSATDRCGRSFDDGGDESIAVLRMGLLETFQTSQEHVEQFLFEVVGILTVKSGVFDELPDFATDDASGEPVVGDGL
jgi:hypothetical protein